MEENAARITVSSCHTSWHMPRAPWVSGVDVILTWISDGLGSVDYLFLFLVSRTSGMPTLPLGFILVLGPAVMSIETRLSNTSGRGPRLSMLSLHLVTYSFVLKEEARKGQDAGIWSFLVRVSS